MIWITTFIEVLTPPVEICLQCSKILTRHNNPFKVTVFETKRANSALELTLRFNDYGYATYGKKKKKLAIGITKISDLLLKQQMDVLVFLMTSPQGNLISWYCTGCDDTS